MMEGAGADTYGATQQEQREQSKLMATAVAGQVMQTAKVEAMKMKSVLMHLRDGPASIKILSYIAGVMLVVTGFFAFFGNFFTLHPIDALVHLYLFLFGWVILFIEGRNSVLPKSIVENIHKYAAFTTVVWGRGGFFIFIGTLALAQWQFMDIFLGIYLVCLGAGMIYWGQRAYDTLDAIMQEMKDPQVVQGMFARFDRDHNGVLDAKELGTLLHSLGVEMRPAEVEAALIIMDRDNDGNVTLPEFMAWWSRHDPPSLV